MRHWSVVFLGAAFAACGGSESSSGKPDASNINLDGSTIPISSPDAPSGSALDSAIGPSTAPDGGILPPSDAASEASDTACVPPPAGLAAWWRGDGDYTDSAGGHVGTSAGDVMFTAAEVGQGFLLSGDANSYVIVPDSPTLEISGPMTIDAWINVTTLGGRIVDKIQANGNNGYLLDTWQGNLRMIIGSYIVSSPTSPPTGVLTHVAGVYDGQTVTLYVDGVPVAAQTFAASPVPTSQIPLRIGADSDGMNRFVGVLDEVRVFSRALSESEIETIFEQGGMARCP